MGKDTEIHVSILARRKSLLQGTFVNAAFELNNSLDHYFRLFITIVDFVCKAPASKTDQYVELFLARFGGDVVTVLFYMGIANYQSHQIRDEN